MDQSARTGLNLSYDRDADVLYLAFGEPQEGIDEEFEPGVFIRKASPGGSPVGLTIVDFGRRFSQPAELTLPLQLVPQAV